ncbi:MAG: hypothetical protein B7O98_06305 [Zestosphaera tikiterensis]|uniref:Nascent polypeptide-associated complex protein n=1 Tax=Zestosphaera tikiterensis TaxID=1973259 RepID=A0A2R7Y429_9CREN|nr:MAG: hypothetical protein B7O98_06305 [Zestosphaera tikiterensis]
MKKMMKKLGIDVEELSDVLSVTIELKDKELVIKNPQVTVMKFQGQKIYQVVGTAEEVLTKEAVIEEKPSRYTEEDVRFVMEQTGVSRERALEALERSGGDIAQAILLLSEGRS